MWHFPHRKWCFLMLKNAIHFWRCIFIQFHCLLWSTDKKKKHGYIWTYQNDKIHIHKNNVFEINKLKHVNQYIYCMNHMGMLFRHWTSCICRPLRIRTEWFIVWECGRKICLLFSSTFFLVFLLCFDFFLSFFNFFLLIPFVHYALSLYNYWIVAEFIWNENAAINKFAIRLWVRKKSRSYGTTRYKFVCWSLLLIELTPELCG